MRQTPPVSDPAQGEAQPPADADVTEAVGGAFSRLRDAFDQLAAWVMQNETLALTALATAAGLYIAMLATRMIAAFVIKRFARRDETALPAIFSRAISKIGSLFLLIVAIALTVRLFAVPETVDELITGLLVIAVVIQTALLGQEIAVSLLLRRAQRAGEAGSGLANAVGVLKWLIIGLIWVLTFIILLDTAGIQVTALIAGLGVGGIAIGLAAQGIFSDLFASISILSDKPFKKGDFIIFGPPGGAQISGNVEEIGLRTTRIRALSGEQISVSNTDLLGERVHNYQRLERRRQVVPFGVLYQTPADIAEKIPQWVREDLEAIELLTFDRCHLIAFGDSSLNYELVFWVEAPEFVTFRDKTQEALLTIMRRFDAEGVDFAYPSRTLFLADPSGQPVDPRTVAAKAGAKGTRGG
ncbi:mechanosensitive ion channel family protein [Marinicauda algicola]|uniref:Mechanosensitive ion channel family protein n=1 Tax=Marinicauda algicola TaxID=2029849 RepID=A0A4S2H2Q0_9PROT|nr:mechanosensitive ion channel family protein [Marinicauda algicola]TGY89814.1 mechanosensitive ion channel family protein [Marinicauda algicola]